MQTYLLSIHIGRLIYSVPLNGGGEPATHELRFIYYPPPFAFTAFRRRKPRWGVGGGRGSCPKKETYLL
jgi:hypothetical protein